LTLQRGVNAAVAGDTIIVKAGVYGSNGVGISGFPVQINKAGTAAAPIVLKSETKWGAVLDGGLDCHSYFNLLDGAAYWTIQDFDITRGWWAGLWSNSAAHHNTFRGNHLHHIGNRNDTSDLGIEGFYSDVSSHDLVFDGNTFSDIGRTNILPQGPNHDHGIYSHATNALAINNVFYNMTRGWSIQLVDGATNWQILFNVFAFPNPGRPGQIVLYGGNNGGSISVYNTAIRNNIFYQPSSFAIVTNTSVPLSGCVIDHNVIYGPAAVIDQPQNCSLSANQMNTDPKFVNVAAAPYDWHLQSASPCINAGVTGMGSGPDYYGVIRPQGTIPDIGASEFTQAPPPSVNKPLTIQITWNGDTPISTVKVTGT
jgi:hypothetical protein